MENGLKALIVSDLRVGHESQSVAFCKLKGLRYEIINVSFKFKILKLLAYVLDFLMIYLPIFSYTKPKYNSYGLVISAGSSTYYANKFFAKRFGVKNIALMSAKGFRNDFDLVFSTIHDNKNAKNTITLPVNLNLLEQTDYHKPKKDAISFVVGGSNKNFKMDSDIVKVIADIMQNFKDHEYLITTSPRTPKSVTSELMALEFDFFVDFHKDRINPIYDFVKHSKFIFITQDSVSMISEAVCLDGASVVVLPLKNGKKGSKFDKFIKVLSDMQLLSVYDERVNLKKSRKLDLAEIINKVEI